MQKPYGMACDYWSIGVVAFIILSGTPPFYEEDNFALFEKIKNCEYDFDVETWDSVSAEAKDFISRILVADPDKRLNCDEMMAHPWMQIQLDESNLISVKGKLSKYVSVRRE